MCKVEKLTELVGAQSVKMVAQLEAVDVQSVKMTEHFAKLGELQGASDDARTGEHLERLKTSDCCWV